MWRNGSHNFNRTLSLVGSTLKIENEYVIGNISERIEEVVKVDRKSSQSGGSASNNKNNNRSYLIAICIYKWFNIITDDHQIIQKTH